VLYALQVPIPPELARAVFQAIDEQDEDLLEQLIHPDAVLEMAMARGDLVQGRSAVLETLRSAWQSIHTLRIDELHPVSDEAVIIVGRSRYPTSGGGFADSGLVWLCEYRDGMLWRQRLFTRLDDARAAVAASTAVR
jgi:ketosteroid isomerase-like protein